jgi:hypothetical protein
MLSPFSTMEIECNNKCNIQNKQASRTTNIYKQKNGDLSLSRTIKDIDKQAGSRPSLGIFVSKTDKDNIYYN